MAIPSIDQIKRALHIQESIEKLQDELRSIFGERIPHAVKAVGDKVLTLVGLGGKRKKPHFSKAARASIARAQRARWAKLKEGKAATAEKPAKRRKKSKMSAAGRAAIVKAQKARWAKVKAEKARGGKV